MLRDQQHRSYVTFALRGLGWAWLLRGDHEQAEVSFGEGVKLSQELGDKLGVVDHLDGLACAATSQGEVGRAARLFVAARMLREATTYQGDWVELKLREA